MSYEKSQMGSTLPKRLRLLRKNPTKILELKNSINETENALEGNGDRADHKEEGTSELQDGNLEMIQAGEERELRLKTRDPTRAIPLHQEEQQKDSGHPRRRRQGKGAQSLFRSKS